MRQLPRLVIKVAVIWLLSIHTCVAQAAKKQPPAGQPVNVQGTASSATPASGGRVLSPLCNPKLPIHSFSLDASGNVSDKGRSFEGPACIQVFYNPFQYEISLSQTTTTTAGPDLSQVALGGGKAAGGAPGLAPTPSPTPVSVSQAFTTIAQEERFLRDQLDQVESSYNQAIQKTDAAIAAIKRGVQNTSRINPAQLPPALRNTYLDLQKPLRDGLGAEKFIPTDLPNNLGTVLTLAFRQTADKLSNLALQFPDGIRVDSANPPKCKGDDRNFAFRDWISVCKDSYDGLKKQLDDDLQRAMSYASRSDNVGNLKSKVAILKHWNLRFQNIGLRTEMEPDEIKAAPVENSITTAVPVLCGTLFNQSSSTAVSVLSVDETPTLDGSNPTVKMQDAFVSVTCATPFSVSAGIGFNTIQQQEFAIIKSAGGPNNTSVNRFGTLNSSQISPMAMAMAHVRLREWVNHKYAAHASFGVGANIQGQAAGGSSAAYLAGASFSFWRTMYVSGGALIASKPSLAGGFSVGDLVPTDITTINGLVKRSYTTGFGFAITFTKP